MDAFLGELQRFDAIRTGDAGDDEILTESVDRIQPAYASSDILNTLHPTVADQLRKIGISLYEHQADAINKARAGTNVVVQAPTASGKTLSFQVPLMERLIADGGHALLIYPTKALGNDQRDQLMRMFGDLRDNRDKRIESWWYDGDIDSSTRKAIQSQPPHILITTPEMVHNSFLAHSRLWTEFLKNLRFVVIDEMHEYRGYFGSNMSLLLRRLSHHLSSMGVSPQFFLASATCANAQEHAENLTGLTFEEVSSSDQFRPRRDFYFVRPGVSDHDYWRIFQLRVVNAALASMAMGKAVLVFCPTRKFAEESLNTARRRVEDLRNQGVADLDVDAIRVFRGGLSPEERHEIQDGLRDGSVRIAFTTNALELGIDIGGLDGVILAGFPDSIMSAWQRIGRAGRSWDSDAFVLYFARNSPLDQFYAQNLAMFLEKPLDELVVNPQNEELIERHWPCLLYETSEIEGGKEILGKALYEAAHTATLQGKQPITDYPPHPRVDIRGAGTGTFKVRRGNEDIGTLSAHQQFREAYQDAIYMHGGATYRVESIELKGGGGVIHLADAPDPFRRTLAHIVTTTQAQELFDGHRWRSRVDVMYGNITVAERIVSIREYDERNGDNTLDSWSPNANSATYSNAHAFWIQISDASGGPGTNLEIEGVEELQHLLRLGTLFTIPTETHDVIPYASATDRAAYLIESHAGGIGIARKVFEQWQEILATGVRMAEECNCRAGCPICIVPPRAHGDLDKWRGITLAYQLLSLADGPHDDTIENYMWAPVGQ